MKRTFRVPLAGRPHSHYVGRLQARAIAHASLHHSRGEDGARIPIVGLSADHLPVPTGEICKVGIFCEQGLADARETMAAVIGDEDHAVTPVTMQ